MFSTNAQKFALDPALNEQFRAADISSATLPFDFQQPPDSSLLRAATRVKTCAYPVMLPGFGVDNQ